MYSKHVAFQIDQPKMKKRRVNLSNYTFFLSLIAYTMSLTLIVEGQLANQSVRYTKVVI